MGKNGKTQRALKRASEKRARKAANQAQYQKWAEDGRNSKSLRFRRKSSEVSKIRVKNPDARNIGDLEFYPEMLEPLIDLYLRGQYTGRYKGLLRSICLQRNLISERQ